MAVTDVDSVTLEIVNNRLEEIVQEMQYTIFRTGYSTIIRESKDTSACITSADGQVVGQAFQHPAHMGVFQETIHGISDNFDAEEIREGDVFIANDPYVSGSPHPSDIVVARPVFVDGELLAFSLNVAHKPDIGGLVPGTATGEARELYHEGLLLPPVKWMDAGTKNDDIEEIIRQNSRIPDITVGDLRGQVGCTRIGEEKLLNVFDEYGTGTVSECFDRLIRSTQTQLEDRFADLEVTEAEDEIVLDIPRNIDVWTDDLDDDETLRFHVRIEERDGRIIFDWRETDDQTDYPVNIRPNILKSVCYYCLLAVTETSAPNNQGVANVCDVITREGSVVDPVRPAPVNQYSYTVVMLTRLVLRALSKLTPGKAIADDGAVSAVAFGGQESDNVQYEVLMSSYGGTSRADGVTGVSTHTINVEVTPIEIIETEFPNRVTEYSILPDSEGAGKHRGGFGIRREYEVQKRMQYSYRALSSNVFPPRGIDGGRGPEFALTCTVSDDGEEVRLPTVANSRMLSAGDRVRLDFPGGGGYGEPDDRDPEAVLEDYLNGFLTADRAEEVYGVRIDTENEEIDRVLR